MSTNGNVGNRRGDLVLWISGLWVIPLVTPLWSHGLGYAISTTVFCAAALLAPVPAFLYLRRQRLQLRACVDEAEETAAQLRLQLDTVRYRTSRLREELQMADRQARLSHQLTLLGQFTAGFMHEFNNPLAIVAGRLPLSRALG